jgi:transcriptional regulator of NAD metabolism
MSNRIDINFCIGGDITQTIQILNNDSRREFFEKLKNGTYLTSLFEGTVMDVTNKLEVVGQVLDSSVGDSTEYFDWEWQDESYMDKE